MNDDIKAYKSTIVIGVSDPLYVTPGQWCQGISDYPVTDA